jgi:3-oxoacyl-[acyl-carrier-protein] synthase-3
MSLNAAITGWGIYTPAHVLRNDDLERLVDTSDEWIFSRTGIRERHIASPGETTSTMCTAAGQQALEHAGLTGADIELVLCASTTPDYLLPASACLVQQRLGATQAGAMDINAACSGFIYALAVAHQFIQAGTYRRILVTVGETLTRFINYEDRGTCVLFGDGAAAVVLEATSQEAGVLSTVLGSRGDVEKSLAIEGGGGACPATPETVASKAHFLRMRGNEVFRQAVRAMTQAANQAILKANLGLTDIHAVIPHQANQRIITATQEALGVSADKFFINVDRYGNTGAASVPIALVEKMAGKQPAQIGDNLLLVAFGGGYTWGAAVVRWADIAAIRQERCQRLSA